MTATRTTWTADMDATLCRLYPRHSAAECAAPRKIAHVRSRA